MANTGDWGLTPEGFRRPSYSEILDGFEYQTREKFTKDGKAPNLTVRSPLGILIRIWAWIVNLLFQLIEDVYNSQFVDTAVGASLYQLGRNIGLKLLPAQRASGYEQVNGVPGTEVPAGYLVGTVAGIQFAVQLPGVIGTDGTVTVPIQCTEFGTVGNVAEHTIKEIINPISGIESVTNLSPTDGGRGRETDEQFRDRYARSVDFAGGVNADAIQAEILQTVEGVLAARVYENETDEIDSKNIPPHAIESVVYSGLGHEIARAIYRRKSGGIQTYGNTMVEIVSPQNEQVYKIYFTRPTGIPVWVKLFNLQIDSTAFPTDGETQIRNALKNYIGSDITGGLNIGKNIVYIQLPGEVLKVPGVVDFDMMISSDGSTYSRDNIVINVREKAVTGDDKISISFKEEDAS